MPAERFFSENLFHQNLKISIEDQEFHHLAHVMRSSIDDNIEIVNGQGQLAYGVIKEIQKKRAIIQIEDTVTESPPTTQIILAQAIPRTHRLETILEKGTELGMTEIWLFPGSHSEKKIISSHQLERFKIITIAALKQCGRFFLPKIQLMPSINKWKDLPCRSFFGDIRPKANTFFQEWKKKNVSEKILFFVGPESGFSIEEIENLEHLQAVGVKLHANILRTDTAALTALSLISHWLL